ncbi:MAG: hypothetical protein U1F43_03035 [Myxococcota bacterium]
MSSPSRSSSSLVAALALALVALSADAIAAPPTPTGPFHLGHPSLSTADLAGSLRAWIDALDLTPLVSLDGATVAVPHVALDGARGNANLSIVLIATRGDEVSQRLTVLDADEVDPGEADRDEAAFAKRLLERVAGRVDRALAELAKGQWRPLQAMAATPEETNGPLAGPYSLVADGHALAVTFKEPKLTLKLDKKVVIAAAKPKWSAPSKRCPKGVDAPGPDGCGCENPASLDAAWADPSLRVVLLEIGYRGTDTCWEPDSEEHALTF